MKVRALFSGCDLTEGKIYNVIFEYDTVMNCNAIQNNIVDLKHFLRS